jgi:flagellar protein FlaG
MGLEIPAILKSNSLPDMVVKDQYQVTDRPQGREQAAPVANAAEIDAQLRALEKTFLAFNHRVKLSVNEEIDQVIIKVVDSETDKVIKEIPAQEIQNLIAKIKQAIGLLVDEKI